ncbi:hypothetical protein [Halomontanus rarus]|uniref:hypothetical protein n=1 Tax=Halomontanus rarus TaxID=3034020 RepID=UPI0023E814D0|nr:hypothetical protein [Halovivax sp. TS33]
MTATFESRDGEVPPDERRRHDHEQLFDLVEDSDKMIDLSTSAHHEDVLDAHRKQLLEWCLRHNDQFDSHWVRRDVPAVPGFGSVNIYERAGGDRSATDVDWDATDYSSDGFDDREK